MTATTCAEAGRLGGSSKSAAKQRASRLNGRLGGRPRKNAPVPVQSATSAPVVVAPATEQAG